MDELTQIIDEQFTVVDYTPTIVINPPANEIEGDTYKRLCECINDKLKAKNIAPTVTRNSKEKYGTVDIPKIFIENNEYSDVTICVAIKLYILFDGLKHDDDDENNNFDEKDKYIVNEFIDGVKMPCIKKDANDVDDISCTLSNIIQFLHKMKKYSDADDVYLITFYMYVVRCFHAKYKLLASLHCAYNQFWKAIIATFYIISRKGWTKNTKVQTRGFARIFDKTGVDGLRKLEKMGLKLLNDDIKIRPIKYKEVIENLIELYDHIVINHHERPFQYTDHVISNEFTTDIVVTPTSKH